MVPLVTVTCSVPSKEGQEIQLLTGNFLKDLIPSVLDGNLLFSSESISRKRSPMSSGSPPEDQLGKSLVEVLALDTKLSNLKSDPNRDSVFGSTLSSITLQAYYDLFLNRSGSYRSMLSNKDQVLINDQDPYYKIIYSMILVSDRAEDFTTPSNTNISSSSTPYIDTPPSGTPSSTPNLHSSIHLSFLHSTDSSHPLNSSYSNPLPSSYSNESTPSDSPLRSKRACCLGERAY